MTVNQLLANLDAAELIEWQAFFSMEQKELNKPKDSPQAVSENIKVAFEGMR
jgi:hypothetical protein